MAAEAPSSTGWRPIADITTSVSRWATHTLQISTWHSDRPPWGLWYGHAGWMYDHDTTNTNTYAKDLLQDPAIAG